MAKMTVIDPLSYIFDSPELLRVLRYLVFNESQSFTKADFSETLNITKRDLNKILKLLESSELVRSYKRGKYNRYRIQRKNSQFNTLKQLLRYDYQQNTKILKQAFKETGLVKSVIITGSLVGNNRTDVDLVVLAVDYDQKKLTRLIQDLGYQTGFELTYVVMTPEDFQYRQEMNDRMVRNILDFNHHEIF